VSRGMQGVLGVVLGGCGLCGLCLNRARHTHHPLAEDPKSAARMQRILDDSRRPIVCKDRDAAASSAGMDGID
jgi:hypothetical protein